MATREERKLRQYEINCRKQFLAAMDEIASHFKEDEAFEKWIEFGVPTPIANVKDYKEIPDLYAEDENFEEITKIFMKLFVDCALNSCLWYSGKEIYMEE